MDKSTHSSNASLLTTTKTSKSLLSQQGHYVLPFTLVWYIVMQSLTGYNSICDVKETYSPWVDKFYFSTGIAFLTTASGQLAKIWQHWQHRGINNEFRGHIFVAAAFIGVSSGTACLLTSELNYGGICRDVLGVDSPAAQWSEWLACVPLMTYLVVALEDKDALTFADYAIIGLMGFSVLAGFLMNIKIGLSGGITLLILGCLCLLGALFFVIHKKRVILPSLQFEYGDGDGDGDGDGEIFSEEKFREMVSSRKRHNLFILISTIFPLFPVVYILGWMKIIERDEVAVAYVLVSISSKLLFVNSLLDAHVGLSDSLETSRLAKKRININQRDFLRFVFHELRIPLNTITLGIELVQSDSSRGQEVNPWAEALRMMKGAAVFMNDTLNDVLQMHRIQEGGMTLIKSAFMFRDVVREASKAVQPILDRRNLTLVVKTVLSNAPVDQQNEWDDCLLHGDRQFIERMLVFFLNHAAKVSPCNSSIRINITKHFRLSAPPRKRSMIGSSLKSSLGEKDECSPSIVIGNMNSRYTECVMTVTVTDQSPGLSDHEVRALMNPYGQTRPEQAQEQQEEQGRGTGLWLVIAKGIVAIHGGELIAQKNTFGFSIPFQVAPAVRPRLSDISTRIGPRSNSRDCLLEDASSVSPGQVETRISSPSPNLTSRKLSRQKSSLSFASTLLTIKRHQPAVEAAMLAESVQAIEQNAKAGPSIMPFTRPPEARGKFLVVDDTASNRKMLEMVLRTRQIQCDIAEDGKIAVDMVTTDGDGYDFIFMDFTMPVMNGAQATRAIRQLGFNRLIFGLSGNALDDDRATFLAAGADCMIAKPLRGMQLDAILKHTSMHGFGSHEGLQYVLDVATGDAASCELRVLQT